MTNRETVKSLSEYVFEEMGFVVTDRQPSQVALQVLERSSTIEYFGNSKPQVRGGLFYLSHSATFGVLLAIGQIVKYVYICWLNYHSDYDRQVLRVLEQQEFLMVRFYGSNLKVGRIYLLENTLGDLIRKARTHVEKLPRWSPDAYGKLVAEVSFRLGHGMTLWQRLESGIPLIDLDMPFH